MVNNNLTDKALQKVSALINIQAAQTLRAPLERIQELVRGTRILGRIASSSDREQLEDYLAEVRYVLAFVGLGFQVEVEPMGKKGPDARVSRENHSAIVEITRFRKMYPGPPVLDLSDESSVLAEYGNPPRDIQKSFEKILAKFNQVGDEEAIIAIWNDDEDLEELEVEAAVINIRRDASQGALSLPSGLLFVLYGSKWVRAGNHKQLSCFPLRYLGQPHQLAWQRELEVFTVGELVQRALTQGTDAR